MSAPEFDEMPRTLHSITVACIKNTYETFNIREAYNQVPVVHAALRYLGCNPDRSELALLMGELSSVTGNEAWTPEIFATLAKHAYATLGKAWVSYYESVRIAADILEVDQQPAEDVPFMNDPYAYLEEIVEKIKNIQTTNKAEDTLAKCGLIASLYAPFAAPEVENDEMLFGKLMEAVNPIFLNEV